MNIDELRRRVEAGEQACSFVGLQIIATQLLDELALLRGEVRILADANKVQQKRIAGLRNSLGQIESATINGRMDEPVRGRLLFLINAALARKKGEG